jgi:hypothetical protein
LQAKTGARGGGAPVRRLCSALQVGSKGGVKAAVRDCPLPLYRHEGIQPFQEAALVSRLLLLLLLLRVCLLALPRLLLIVAKAVALNGRQQLRSHAGTSCTAMLVVEGSRAAGVHWCSLALGSKRRLCCHSSTFFCTNSTLLSCKRKQSSPAR